MDFKLDVWMLTALVWPLLILQQARMLAGEITSRGAHLYELLEEEVDLRVSR